MGIIPTMILFFSCNKQTNEYVASMLNLFSTKFKCSTAASNMKYNCAVIIWVKFIGYLFMLLNIFLINHHCEYQLNWLNFSKAIQIYWTCCRVHEFPKSAEIHIIFLYLLGMVTALVHILSYLGTLGYDSGESVHIRISQEWFTFEDWIHLVKVFY